MRVPCDTTVFLSASIEKLIHTISEAVVLVVGVILLFMGSLRAALIPLVAIPVSVVGVTAILLALGFSINTLTLLAVVLAIVGVPSASRGLAVAGALATLYLLDIPLSVYGQIAPIAWPCRRRCAMR